MIKVLERMLEKGMKERGKLLNILDLAKNPPQEIQTLLKEQELKKQNEALRSTLSTLKQIEAVSGILPKKKETICDTAPFPNCNGAIGCDTCEYQEEEGKEYNQAIDECTLAFAKRWSMKNIKNVIRFHIEAIGATYGKDNLEPILDAIAQDLHKMIGGER